MIYKQSTVYIYIWHSIRLGGVLETNSQLFLHKVKMIIQNHIVKHTVCFMLFGSFSLCHSTCFLACLPWPSTSCFRALLTISGLFLNTNESFINQLIPAEDFTSPKLAVGKINCFICKWKWLMEIQHIVTVFFPEVFVLFVENKSFLCWKTERDK